MKRDMYLVYAILCAMENGYDGLFPEIEGWTDEYIHGHLGLMTEGGLIIADPVAYGLDSTYDKYIPNSITWLGYNFLEGMRQDFGMGKVTP